METTALLQQKFAHYGTNAARIRPIFEEVAGRLCDRLLDTKNTFSLGLDMGAGLGSVRRNLPPQKQPHLFIEADFCPQVLQKNTSQHALIMDGEAPFPFAAKTFDLITTNLMLPWVQNVPKFLAQSGRALAEDGLFLASTLGENSFYELQTAFSAAGSDTPHTNPMPDVQTVGEALQNVGFALPVIDRDKLILEYDNFANLWADLKALGATNMHPARCRGLMTPRLFQRVEEQYRFHFATPQGTFPLTLEIIYLHGWRPHKSQQKPLPRGSGQVDLSQVLAQNK